MKSMLIPFAGVMALGSLGGCYAEVSPYAYPSAYAPGPAYYSAPVYTTGYAAPVYTTGYASPVYRPAPRVYMAPRGASMYRPVVAPPHHRRYW